MATEFDGRALSNSVFVFAFELPYSESLATGGVEMQAASQRSERPAQRRRSDRLYLRIPLSIVGTDASGCDFTGHAFTQMLSRFGASIVTKRLLQSDQEMTLIPAERKPIRARVIGQTSIIPEGHVYGIEFLNSTVEFWGIHFPPSNEAAAATVELECCTCQARESVGLNELQFEVFQANDRLGRACRQCGDLTTWRLAEPTLVRKPPQPARPSAAEIDAAAPHTSTRSEPAALFGPQPQRRLHPRVRVNLKACISQPGSQDDIATVINMSRGGILISSERVYAAETWVQLAVPYTAAAANIFVPARIVRRTDGEGNHLYGIKYVGR